MEKACINCAYASESYPSFTYYCDLDGHVILDANEYSCKNFYPLEQEDDDGWINGNIEPPELGEYYTICEYKRTGEIWIDSDIWDGKSWETLGENDSHWQVIAWARVLRPDIPEDLQGQVTWYFGKEVKNDG